MRSISPSGSAASASLFNTVFQPTRSIPNCVPQSPMWLSRMTLWPVNVAMREIASPKNVERMWPTCIGFATLGEEKSSTMRLSPGRWRLARRACRVAGRCGEARASIQSRFSRKLMNPAPAISGGSHISETSSLSMICCASCRGLAFASFASTIATFVW